MFDLYLEDSLKTGIGSNRGAGVRRKVTENGILPSNWKPFLRCSENKKELFPFLSKNTIDGLKDYKIVVATTDENVLCNQSLNLDDIRPCNIEEADERMLLHVNHAAKQFSKHLIKTVDSDVIVISVTVFNQLQGVNELWIEFGRGKTLKYIPIHEIVNSLGKVSSRAVSFLHALSGCDTTSAVAGKGKLSFYNTWSQLPEITPTFAKLGNVTDVNLVTDDDFTQIERFFIILCSPTLNTENINTARRILFTQGSRSLENIPPTFNCLQKHILRSCYQATNCSNALLKQRPHLDPEDGRSLANVLYLYGVISQTHLKHVVS